MFWVWGKVKRVLGYGEGKGRGVGGVGKCDGVWGRFGEVMGEVWSV